LFVKISATTKLIVLIAKIIFIIESVSIITTSLPNRSKAFCCISFSELKSLSALEGFSSISSNNLSLILGMLYFLILYYNFYLLTKNKLSLYSLLHHILQVALLLIINELNYEGIESR